jgi:hypothetical protein
MDIQIIRDLFDNYLEALNVLRKSAPALDEELQARVLKASGNLLPLQVNLPGVYRNG